MTVGSGPLSLVAGALYVVLFPLSPIIIGFFLGDEKSGANEPISRAMSPDVGEHRKVESLNDAPPRHEAGGGGSLAHPKIMGTNDPSEAIACHRGQCRILPFFS